MAAAAWVGTDTRRVPASHAATEEVIHKDLEIPAIVRQTTPVQETFPVIARMTVGTAISTCPPCLLAWDMFQYSPSASFMTLVQL